MDLYREEAAHLNQIIHHLNRLRIDHYVIIHNKTVTVSNYAENTKFKFVWDEERYTYKAVL